MTTATLNVEQPPKKQVFAMSGSADDVLTIEPKVAATTNANGSELARYRGAVQLSSPVAWAFSDHAGDATPQPVAANEPVTMPIHGKTVLYITGSAGNLHIVTVL